MPNKLHAIFYYIKYLLFAKGKHHIQATFLFKLYTETIKKDDKNSNFTEIEKIRIQLSKNNKILNYKDLGANLSKSKILSEITKTSISPAKYSRLQLRLIEYFQPKNIVEVGTSLGINTLYLSKAAPNSNIFTFEGITEIAAIANENFKKCNANNIQIIEGNFDDTFEKTLQKLASVDYVFIDGNHTYESTLKYFKIILLNIHEESIVIFDDIYWSAEMTKAWKEIIAHQKVTLTINLYKMGIVFFSKKRSKQDFLLKY